MITRASVSSCSTLVFRVFLFVPLASEPLLVHLNKSHPVKQGERNDREHDSRDDTDAAGRTDAQK